MQNEISCIGALLQIRFDFGHSEICGHTRELFFAGLFVNNKQFQWSSPLSAKQRIALLLYE